MDLTKLNLTDEQMAEVSKALQAEGDRVRTEYSNKLKAKDEELTKLKPVEKTEDEINFETRLKALEDREKAIAKQEFSNSIENKLAEKGIPKELSKYLNISADNTDTEIEEISKTFSGFLQEKGYKPQKHSHNEGVTLQDYKKMSYNDRVALAESNPTLFESFQNK